MSEPKRRVTSLADLTPTTVVVELERPDGETVELVHRPLAYSKFVQLGQQVPTPAPPIMGVDKDGRPIHNERDETYLNALNDAATRRGYLRLFASYDIDVPGDTLEEKIAAFEGVFSYGETARLIAVVNMVQAQAEARVAERAATFHVNGAGGTPDRGGAGVDAGPVLAPDGGAADGPAGV